MPPNAIQIMPGELRRGDIIPGSPTRVVRSATTTPSGRYVNVVCENMPDYQVRADKAIWIVRD